MRTVHCILLPTWLCVRLNNLQCAYTPYMHCTFIDIPYILCSVYFNIHVLYKSVQQNKGPFFNYMSFLSPNICGFLKKLIPPDFINQKSISSGRKISMLPLSTKFWHLKCLLITVSMCTYIYIKVLKTPQIQIQTSA